MRLSDFQTMIRRMSDELPPEFTSGIAEIVVSPRTVPHPSRPEIYTLGECIPLPAGESGGGPEAVQSRIVLYHGSFAALAQLQTGFDWREEAWETLTHELKHHLEWRARAPDLEEFDWAVEQNFARLDGEPFDPVFHLDGESLGPDVYGVEDSVFLDRVVSGIPDELVFSWRNHDYRVPAPGELTLPAFITLEGVADPPEGDLVLVLRRKPGILALLRPTPVFQATVRVDPSPGYLSGPEIKGRTT